MQSPKARDYPTLALRQHLALLKPSTIPDKVWHNLIGMLQSKNLEGKQPDILAIWQSKGPSHVWRAKITLQGVSVIYYFSPSKERWCRS